MFYIFRTMNIRMMTGRYLTRLVWLVFIVIINCYCSVSAQILVVIQPLNLVAFSGETAVFECNNVNPPIDFSHKWIWFINQEYLIATEGGHISDRYNLTISNGRTRSTLTILDTKIEDDKSQYFCQFGSISQKATLTVIPERLGSIYPKCKANLTSINIDRTVTMKCYATGGDPRPELQWYRNGIELGARTDFFDGNSSYFDEFTYEVTVDDEDAMFICTAEGIAVDGNQACQVHLNVPPTVVLTSNRTSFSAEGSFEFTCLVMSPWNIKDYIWTVDDTLVTNSEYSLNLTADKSKLIIKNLQNTRTEIGCIAVTRSGLNGTDSVVIFNDDDFDDEINTLLIVVIVIGILAFLLVICTIFSLLIKLKRKKNFKTSFNEQVISTEPRTFREHPKDGIVQVMPLDNPTFINENNPDYDNNIPSNHFIEIQLNEQQIEENILYDTDYNVVGQETYVNAGSVMSFGSFSSFDSFDQEHEDDRCTYYNVGSQHSIRSDMMYAQVLKANHVQASASATSVDGVADFGDLYAKPIKMKQKSDTRSLGDVIDARQLYAKPNKQRSCGLTQHRPSIHHSLENILGGEDDTLRNRSESVDDLYSKPNKKRLTVPSNQLALYAEPDKLKPTIQPRPLIYTTGRTTFQDEQPASTSSNAIEHDFTYASIA